MPIQVNGFASESNYICQLKRGASVESYVKSDHYLHNLYLNDIFFFSLYPKIFLKKKLKKKTKVDDQSLANILAFFPLVLI